MLYSFLLYLRITRKPIHILFLSQSMGLDVNYSPLLKMHVYHCSQRSDLPLYPAKGVMPQYLA
jgi:hypothetical protein